MKIKQILLCMLLACFILPASAQNSWGIVGGGLFSKSLSRDARFSLGGYAGGMYDVHVKNSWYVQPQLLFTYEEFRSKTRLGTDSFFSKFNLELPILASYNVALNNKWNLRINAGPYLSYAMFGRDKSIDYAYGNGMHSSLGWWHQDFPDIPKLSPHFPAAWLWHTSQRKRDTGYEYRQLPCFGSNNKEPNQAARYYNKIPLDSKDTASCLL